MIGRVVGLVAEEVEEEGGKEEEEEEAGGRQEEDEWRSRIRVLSKDELGGELMVGTASDGDRPDCLGVV